jgi:Secretion system C-terminal sorting domain
MIKFYYFLVSSMFYFMSATTCAQEEIRIMAYNILDYPNSTTVDSILVADTTGRNPYFRTTISSVNPDILVIQEVERGVDADSFLVNVMNSFGETYDLYFYGTTGDDNAIYMKSSKFGKIDSSLVIDQTTTGAHPTIQFKIYHKQTRDTLVIFNTHLTAGNTSTARNSRKIEADSIRARSDAFSSGSYFIALGDFNTYGGTEDGFVSLLNQANSGYFIDPLDLQDSTNWSANWLTEFNTFSTRKGAGDFLGGGSSSGLDERLDLILNSQSVVDSGGITYVTNSYVTYGNDGLHNNIDINANGSTGLPNQAVSQSVADALYYASDHLPVYADFYFGSPAPGSIIFTQVGASSPNIIEFITLYDKMDLTKLKITNSEVNSTGDLVNGNGTYDLSNTPWKEVPGGTFVRLGSNLTNDNDPSDRILKYDGTGSTVPTLSTGSTGEQLIAYTGSSSAPYYIAGVTWGNDGWLTAPGSSFAPNTISDIALGTSNDYYYSGTVDGDAPTTRNAITDTSNWSSYSGTTYNDLTSSISNSALPVELSFFTGVVNGAIVELRWRTETEVNNYGFEIERSLENTDWKMIGFVEGSGNSNSPRQYTFNDVEVGQSGEYYYRLKQIDNDGTFEYSEVVTVILGIPQEYYLSQNYPNPFNPSTRINFTLPEMQLVNLKVYNVIGELVKEIVNEIKDAGSYSVTFDASNLPSGIYIYRLETASFSSSKKMTLLK